MIRPARHSPARHYYVARDGSVRLLRPRRTIPLPAARIAYAAIGLAAVALFLGLAT